jgi:S1-C subfamily serine protease
VAPLPPPLPEALAWEAPAAQGAFLGIDGEENSGDSLDSLTFEPGVRVVRVVQNSPAAQVGVSGGDVVLEVDGHEVDDPGALEARIQAAGAGSEVELTVLRDDTVFGVAVTLAGSEGPAAAPEPRYRLDPSRSRAGWATVRDGVRLVTSAPDGPFLRDGVPTGSVVQALDDERVVSARQFIRRLQAMEPGSKARLRVRLPGGSVIERSVRLHEQPTRLTEFGVPVLLGWEAAADGSSADFSLIDLWFFQLFQYHRDRNERRWVLLELFGFDLIATSTGVGELE